MISAGAGAACREPVAVATAALEGKNATFANPAIFVGLVQWCDKVLTE